MAYQDLRAYIAALEETGDAVAVQQEVDWDLEAGAVVRRACELGSPAPFFQRVKDYPGMRMFGAPVATFRRLAVALGLDATTHPADLLDEYFRRARVPVAPVRVPRGSCQQNRLLGADVDLFRLPAPMVHDGDGGRYIGTWHYVVTRDPDDGWVNWGMYRLMIYDEDTMMGLLLPTSDGGLMLARYRARGQRMPFAAVIGDEPLGAIASCGSLDWKEESVRTAGGLRQEPVQLVPCLTVDLEVPAHAEIVIEGEVLPDPGLEEGPFGEYTGYRVSPRGPRSIFRVKAITFRDEPIMTISNMGVPMDEGQLVRSFTISAVIRRSLERDGIPVSGVWMWPESTHHTVVVGLRSVTGGLARRVAALVFASKLGYWMHQVIVVDDDVDVYNMKEVIHAFATRCHPVRDVIVFEGFPTPPLMPFLDDGERRAGVGPKLCFDCTWKAFRPRKISFASAYPREIQELVLTRWQEYGFPSPWRGGT